MPVKLICEDKYQFSSPNNVIGLPVQFENLPKSLEISGSTLSLKETFHVSLVCVGKIIEKYNVSIPTFQNKIINDFCEFTKTNEIKLLEYKDFKFAKENNLKTLVVMCDLSNLNIFFEIMNKKYGLNVEYPPTHVTLYASSIGIFLTDANDIKNLTKPIANPVGHLLL